MRKYPRPSDPCACGVPTCNAPPIETLDLEPGDYGLVRFTHFRPPEWIIRTPNGYLGSIRNHTVVEHADGTITVTPSIVVYGGSDGRGGFVELYHGFIERGAFHA